MIVPSMTSKEIVSEIFSDFEVVKKKVNYLAKSLRREVVKSKSKHVHRIFDYKTKKYNNWKIILDYHYKMPRYIALVYYRDYLGLHVLKIDRDFNSLTHFTPHFISRYNERYAGLKSISSLDLLVNFIEDNFIDSIHYTYSTDPYKSEIFCKFNDGVGLGYSEYFPDIEKKLFHFRTFITDGMLFEDQMKKANKMKSGIQKYLQEHRLEFPKRA